MRKIVHIHHSLMPGMGYQENQLPAKIAELGYDIEIITSSFPPAQFSNQEDGFKPGIYEYNGVKTHRLPTRWRLKSIEQGFLKGLGKKLKEISPDIIQSRSLLTTQTPRAARFADQHDTCLLIDEHVDNDNFNITSPLVRTAYETYKRTVAKYVISQCDMFLPVQPYSKAFLQEEFGIPTNQMEILPLGVDKTTFYPDKSKRIRIREMLNIPNESTLIITAGNFEQTKDLHILLDSVSHLNDNNDVLLMFVGRPSGPEGEEYYRSIKDKVLNKGIEDQVIFQGFVPRERLNAFYNAADIGVWPGKLGVTTAEAIGSGLPVIVCESAATDYLISRENGFTFERGNARELRDKLVDYIENEDLIRKHQDNALLASKEDLSWDAIAEKNIRLYDQIC